jgi:trimethylamine---corrinoid protein Co-methyltransferase
MSQLKLKVLDDNVTPQIIEEGFALLVDPGIRVHNRGALTLLADAGATVDFERQVAHIPETLARKALETVPSSFDLYNMAGEPVVHYGGDAVHFDPGSAAISILDSSTQQQRKPVSEDLVKYYRLVETLPAIDAQSTCMVSQDVPEGMGDWYRLYLALLNMQKPIITGAFGKESWWVMKELLTAARGSEAALAEKPLAVFDVCPSPPLLWSDLTCQNLIDCARFNIPAELVSMPLAGATAPVTLAAAVVQHAAECLSGITIHQVTNPGAPIVWGGSPAAFDMRQGTTPMGDVGTWLIDCAYTQVGKALNLPTHAYLGMSDAKIIDAQCGMETAGGMIMAILSGINMISGAGMLDFETCQSFEKLVIDAELIGMYKHLIKGIQIRENPIALNVIRKSGHRADYLAQPHTLKWFSKEQYIPSEVIDRSSLDGWKSKGAKTVFERARDRFDKLLQSYQPPAWSSELRPKLDEIALSAARKAGIDRLPDLSQFENKP